MKPVNVVLLVIAILFVLSVLWRRHEPHPTADQRYGCTIAQQAPNGDCP